MGLTKGGDTDCWTNLMDTDNKFYNIAGVTTNGATNIGQTITVNDDYSMTLNGVNVNPDSVEFTINASNSGLIGTKDNKIYIPYTLPSDGTIEFCGNMNWLNSSQIIIYSVYGGMMLAFSPQSSSRKIAYYRNATQEKNAFKIPSDITSLPGKITISVTEDFFLMNGQKYMTDKDHANWSTGVASGINTRNYAGTYVSLGKYHSIRVYDRKLTEEEMRINQLNDIARFKLY